MRRASSLALILTTVCLGTAAATVHPFTVMGPADPLVNGLRWDVANQRSYLFVTTEEGFYAWDQDTQAWDDYTRPGWIGVARTAVIPVEGQPDRRILGGVNAFFKGTLWLSDDQGATQELTRESTGGRVTDLARSRAHQTSLIYACTWSDVAPGELLRSTDDGATWTPVFGHGHATLTGVEIMEERDLYVAGDNHVMRTVDDGATWEDLQGALPDGQGLYFLTAIEPVTALPGKGAPKGDELFTSNDTGLYHSPIGEVDWQLILPTSCRAADSVFRQFGTFVYWTETWAVTFDGRLLLALDHDWDSPDDWQDVTALLGGAEPLDVVTSLSGVYVLTREQGVMYSLGYDYPTGGPLPPSLLALHAAPNPFNPRTTVSFDLPRAGVVELTSYDLRGRLVAHVASGFHAAGRHQVTWTAVDDAGRSLPSGTYLLRLSTPLGLKTSRVALVR